jgi:hypothetical protein
VPTLVLKIRRSYVQTVTSTDEVKILTEMTDSVVRLIQIYVGILVRELLAAVGT